MSDLNGTYLRAPPKINNSYKALENPFGLSLSKPAAWPFDKLRANGGIEFIVKNLISGGALINSQYIYLRLTVSLNL